MYQCKEQNSNDFGYEQETRKKEREREKLIAIEMHTYSTSTSKYTPNGLFKTFHAISSLPTFSLMFSAAVTPPLSVPSLASIKALTSVGSPFIAYEVIWMPILF